MQTIGMDAAPWKTMQGLSSPYSGPHFGTSSMSSQFRHIRLDAKHQILSASDDVFYDEQNAEARDLILECEFIEERLSDLSKILGAGYARFAVLEEPTSQHGFRYLPAAGLPEAEKMILAAREILPTRNIIENFN